MKNQKEMTWKRILQIMYLILMASTLAIKPVRIDWFENFVFDFPLNLFLFFSIGLLILLFSLNDKGENNDLPQNKQ